MIPTVIYLPFRVVETTGKTNHERHLNEFVFVVISETHIHTILHTQTDMHSLGTIVKILFVCI